MATPKKELKSETPTLKVVLLPMSYLIFLSGF